jgi:hypothetical protein
MKSTYKGNLKAKKKKNILKLTRSEATCKVCFSSPSEPEINKANKAISIGPHLAILFAICGTTKEFANSSN